MTPPPPLHFVTRPPPLLPRLGAHRRHNEPVVCFGPVLELSGSLAWLQHFNDGVDAYARGDWEHAHHYLKAVAKGRTGVGCPRV